MAIEKTKVVRDFQGCFWALILIAVGVFVLYETSPKNGEFYWSDAPRHALNGVFVKDFLGDMPFADPSAYAYSYYTKYPALTILFYPPLFYVLSAPIYALLGVSHQAAMISVMLHYFAFGIGCYALARLWLRSVISIAFALTMMFLPEVAFWGRQVMLEIPAYAFMVWSSFCFVHCLRKFSTRWLMAAAVLLVLGMYTKISVGFICVPFAIALLAQYGWRGLPWRSLGIVTGLGALTLLPLVFMTMKFGQANFQSVTGVADSVASRISLEGWVWYAKQFPDQLGWGVLIFCIITFAVWVGRGIPSIGLRRSEVVLLISWLLFGYIFFSLIDLKEARHSIFILLPFVLFGFLIVGNLARPVMGPGIAVCVVALAMICTLAYRPVYFVDGYAKTVEILAKHAPHGSVVLFSGYRDGAFIFNVRANKNRPDISVVRADKLLLRVAVRRELGVEQRAMSEDDMRHQINSMRIKYLVVQPGFWNDLEIMRRFERMLSGKEFRRIESVETRANHKAHERELVIYENLSPLPLEASAQAIELPIIRKTIPAAGSSSK